MIDRKTITHISKLARLSITQAEAEQFETQLNKVLDHFQQISKIDTQNVEPLVTPTDIEYYLRSDEVTTEVKTEEILSEAPDKAGNLFKVPPVV